MTLTIERRPSSIFRQLWMVSLIVSLWMQRLYNFESIMPRMKLSMRKKHYCRCNDRYVALAVIMITLNINNMFFLFCCCFFFFFLHHPCVMLYLLVYYIIILTLLPQLLFDCIIYFVCLLLLHLHFTAGNTFFHHTNTSTS